VRWLALVLAMACGGQSPRTQSPPAPPPKPYDNEELLRALERRNEIGRLWLQIRGWRHDAGWDLDPPIALELEFRSKSVGEARRVCPDGHAEPPSCREICGLAQDICQNAELICSIAGELRNDDLAQRKCTSAKASCRDAEQRCCDCAP
jgi:hypothetical protein